MATGFIPVASFKEHATYFVTVALCVEKQVALSWRLAGKASGERFKLAWVYR